MTETMMAVVEARADKAEQACVAYVRCKVAWAWPGATRAVKGELKGEMTALAGAEDGSVSAGTRLYDWSLEPLAKLRRLRAEARAFWAGKTVPYVEDGVRLLRKDAVEDFEGRMKDYAGQLRGLAALVGQHREAIVEDARRRRGRAFRLEDYPEDLAGLFGLAWGYESLRVPEELREVSEGAYAAEQARQTMRVLGAVQLAEEAMLKELRGLVAHLSGRLSPPEDGKRHLLMGSMVENLRDFCSRFSEVVCWGCDDMAEVVEEAGRAIAGLDVKDLRRHEELRGQLAEDLGRVAEKLDALGLGE